MKLSKAARGRLLALFTLTAVFASVAFSYTSSAKSLADFSQKLLNNSLKSNAPETLSAQRNSVAAVAPTPPKTRGEKKDKDRDEDRDSDRSGKDNDKDGDEDDADIPKFMIGKVDREDYLNRRETHINLLRGIEKGKKFDPAARGRAVRQLDRQEGLPDKNTLTIRTGAADGTDTDMEIGSNGVLNSSNYSMDAANPVNSVWTPIGPAPIPNGQTFGSTHAVSGRVTVIAVHPTNPDIAYVGTAQGGVYRTLDGGITWIPLFDNAQSLAVGSIAIAPSQPSTIYVGTGEASFSCDSYFGVGLYRIDNADSTTPVLTGPFNQETGTGADILTGRSIAKVLVHPTNPDIIFIGANSGIGGVGCSSYPTTASSGLYRATNGTSSNVTFQKITTSTANGGNRGVTDIEFEPGNPNTMLATVRGFSSAGDGGVFRSTDALADNPIFTRTLAIGTTTASARAELAINKIGDVVTVFAAISDSSGTLKRSLDGGQTWSATLTAATGFCGGQCTYDMPIAIEPINANVVYIGGNADGASSAIIKKSVNALATAPTFAKVQNGLHADSHAIEVSPTDNNTVWFGSDGGVWRSYDAAANWTSLNNTGFNATQFVSLAVHPIDPNYTIGGTQDNGTERMKPDGTWARTDYGDGGFALIDQNATNTTTVRQYHTYYNQTGTLIGFATSTNSNAFENWSFYGCGGTANGISCSDTAVEFYAPMALGPGNPNTLYFGTDRLYRSINNGVTMTVVAPQFTSGVSITAIGISRQNDAVRIVGQRNGKVYRTITGGATSAAMANVTGTIPAKYVSRAVIDPNDVNTAYVTLSGFFGNATPHIYKTSNLGDATPVWTGIGNSIPDVPVNAFVVDPADSNMLYAGTDIGVYHSTDGGTTWTAFSNGLPRVAVFDMAIQNTSRTLRIATHGRGMWDISVNAGANPAMLSGTVTDAATGNPVSGATVTVGTSAATTDSNGFYQISQLGAGTYSISAAAAGYDSSTANNVVLTSDQTTTQNFSLTQAGISGCLIDTTQADFQAGFANNVDLTTSPGDVKLANLPTVLDQQQATLNFYVSPINTTAWMAQTFVPATGGALSSIDIQLAQETTGSNGPIIIEIRNVVSGAPGSTVLATATYNSVGAGNGWHSIPFASPATVATGTSYAVVLRADTGGAYRAVRSTGNSYANGAWLTSTNSGGTWASNTTDLAFRTYVTPNAFVTAGNLISSVKDSNPANGVEARWTRLNWTAATPAGTTVKFQAAGSSSAFGPFVFVGPDGTAYTYFTTTNASLSQFNGSRYLKYKAFLNTTNTAATPTLSDVTVCNINAPLIVTALAANTATATYGDATTTLSAVLSASGNPVSGKTVAFTFKGSTYNAATDGSGLATVPNVSISGMNAGTYENAIGVSFAGDDVYNSASGSGNLVINKAVLTITANNKSKNYGDDNPAFTYTPSGFVNGETTSVLSGSPAFDTTATKSSDVGSYPITVSAGSLSADNYSFGFAAGTLTINPVALTITADNKSKQYSDPLPTFTATYAGFVLDQTPANLNGSLSFSTTATLLSPAGTYSIVPSGQTSSNYTITYKNGTLTVTQETAYLTYTGDSLVSTSKNNGSATINLAAFVSEEQDGYLGNTLAGKTVKFLIFKSTNTTMTNADYTFSGVIGSNNIATASASSLSADNYTVRLELVANNQYAAEVEDAIFTVVDPGTGMTTGGGFINDASGSRVHFGFTMKYVPSGNPKGNNIVIYRDNLDLSSYGAPAGVRAYNLIAKSNSMSAMQINNTSTPKTATFTGKNNLFAVDRLTGVSYNIGGGQNLQFQVDVTDTESNTNTTNPDRYALRMWNTTGNFKVVGTYAASGANTSQVAISGGNIQVK